MDVPCTASVPLAESKLSSLTVPSGLMRRYMGDYEDANGEKSE